MNTTILVLVLLELLAKSALLLVGVTAFTALFRRISAAQRHHIWLLAFAALLVLPFTKSIAPRWHLPGSPSAPATRMTMVVPNLTAMPLPPAPVVDLPEPPTKTMRLPSPGRLAMTIWLGGIAVIVAFRLMGSLQLAWLHRRSRSGVSERLAGLARQAAAEMGLRTSYAIRVGEATRVPCTWGLWRPTVLLPTTAEKNWPDERLLAALRHEFAHVTRRDYFTRWISLLTCALYWPNPLVWMAARRLRIAQEQACDDLVLLAGTSASDYANLLVNVARAATGAGDLRAALAMARPSTLEGRVLAIVDASRDRRPAGWKASLAGILCTTAIIGASALAQIAPQPVPPAPAQKASEPKVSTEPATAKENEPTPALSLLPIRVEKVSEGSDGKRLTLVIPIKAQEASHIKLAELMVHVLFYDLVNGHAIESTHADVSSHWLNMPVNWTGRDTEELAVDYHLKPPAAGAPDRKYHGYIVRIYYQQRLQASTGEPYELLEKFPGSAVLPDPSPASKPDGNGASGRVHDADAPAKSAEQPQFMSSDRAAILRKVTLIVASREPTPAEIRAFEDDPTPQDKAYANAILRLLSTNPAAPKVGGKIDRPSLFRRSAFSITGRMPTPEEIRAFVSDPLPDNQAYTQALQRLISSLPASQPKSASLETAPIPEKEVMLTSFNRSMNDGIATATGDAELKWRDHQMHADYIRYDPATRRVDLNGHVIVENGLNRVEASEVTVWLKEGGRIQIEGPHKTTIPDPKPGTAPAPDASVTPPGPDPSDVFVSAYVQVQKGEKFRTEGKAQEALNSWESATQLLDQISKTAPQWNPQIVAYRKQRAADSIASLRKTLVP